MEIEDLAGFDETLADKLHQQPTENLAIFEDAAREVADEITAPRPEHEEQVQDIQVLLSSGANPTNIRDLKVSKTDLCRNVVKFLNFFNLVRIRFATGQSGWNHYLGVRHQGEGHSHLHSVSVV